MNNWERGASPRKGYLYIIYRGPEGYPPFGGVGVENLANLPKSRFCPTRGRAIMIKKPQSTRAPA